MTRDEFKEICNQYVGKLIEDKNSIVFSNENLLEYSYNDYNEETEKIEYKTKKRKVLCTFEIKDDLFMYEEKTCEILGGGSGNMKWWTTEKLKELLERYGFVKIKNKTIDIFDFI